MNEDLSITIVQGEHSLAVTHKEVDEFLNGEDRSIDFWDLIEGLKQYIITKELGG